MHVGSGARGATGDAPTRPRSVAQDERQGQRLTRRPSILFDASNRRLGAFVALSRKQTLPIFSFCGFCWPVFGSLKRISFRAKPEPANAKANERKVSYLYGEH